MDYQRLELVLQRVLCPVTDSDLLERGKTLVVVSGYNVFGAYAQKQEKIPYVATGVIEGVKYQKRNDTIAVLVYTGEGQLVEWILNRGSEVYISDGYMLKTYQLPNGDMIK